MTGRWSTRSVLRMLAAGLLAITATMTISVMLVVGLRGTPLQGAEPTSGAKTVQAPAKQGEHAGKAHPAPAAAGPKPAQIDRNGVLILIRTTLLALDQANKTGNYTVLRDLGSPQFQVNSAARLGEIFAQERRDNVDLSGVAVIDPQLTLLPQIEANGMMHMTGLFPSVPTQVNFDLEYAPVNGRWRLFGIAVSFGNAAPIAPSPPPEPEAKEAPPPTESKSAGEPKQ